MVGLTSVTFRSESVERIAGLAARAGLDGIEWGGDIHVPPGELSAALRARELTGGAGLRVLSYGSYFRLNDPGDAEARFAPVLESAVALGAPAVRIWAGSLSPGEASEGDYCAAARELSSVCAMAAARNILVCMEYHRQTLTETSESALKLIRMAGCENLRTYWQPNPGIPHSENVRELSEILPWLHTVHVFHWSTWEVRLALKEGRADWQDYITTAHAASPNYVMEFVADDSTEAFIKDAGTLLSWLNLK